MGKQKIKQKVYNEQQSEQSVEQQIGQSVGRKDYITLKKNKPKPLTSNEQSQHTVQLFRNEELNKYLAQFDKEDKNQKKKHKNKLSSDPKNDVFQQVLFNIRNGWNACLTGGMDKMEIMDDIVEYLEQKQQNVFIINGYAQPLNEKKIYNAFGTHLIMSGYTKTIDCVLTKDQIEEYKIILLGLPQDTLIYVVFYDLANYAFLSSQMQQKLAQLLSLPKLRVIASVENCKIALHWSFSTSTIQMLNFVFVNCNATCLPITKLLKFMPLPNQKSQKTELQIIQIWKSLNRNQRQIAIILAQNELTNINTSTSEQNYLTFQELLDACIDKIILSDDHQLRQNLIELTDHRVVIEEIDKTKNKKVFIMKLDRRILQNMVEGKYDNYEQDNNH